MADPLSFAASVVAVLAAAEGVAKTLSRVRKIIDAPSELLALINEVSDLQVVLGEVQNYVQYANEKQVSGDLFLRLSVFVDRTNEELLELNETIYSKLLKPQSSPNRIRLSKKGWLKAVRTIEKSRQSLRDTRLRIVTHMVTLTSAFQSRIGLMIDETHLEFGQMQASERSSRDSTRLQLDEHTRLLTNILNNQTNIQNQLQHQSSSKQLSRRPPTGKGLVTSNQLSDSVIHIRAYASYNQQTPCDSQCKCTCHRVRAFRSPTALQTTIGILFAGYSGSPVQSFQKCTEASCTSQLVFRSYIHYLFPSWYLLKAITFTVMSLSNGEINASLTVRRIVPNGADLLRLTALDDAEGVKELLQSGLASPKDVDMYGYTVLNRAVNNRSLRVCDLLLKAGADPHVENFARHCSAFTAAWDIILQDIGNPTELECLRNLFPDNSDIAESREFSKLHKAVLQLEYCDLEQCIKKNWPLINSTDIDGYTVLMWATRRQDRIAINQLVKAGADVHIRNNVGLSAMHFAARFSDLESIEIFLAAGANPEQPTPRGNTVLHYVEDFGSTTARVVGCLVAAGADPNARNEHGITPFIHYAMKNCMAAAQALLENGADVNIADHDGDTALFQSIYFCSDDITELLLSRGAAYTSWCSTGYSILHLAALSGGLRTLAILHAAELQGLDPDAPCGQGQTPLQLAQARVSKPEGFVERLWEVLVDIRTRNANLRRANADKDKSVSNPRHLSFVEKIRDKIQARFSHGRRDMRKATTRMFKKRLRTCVQILLCLASIYVMFSYICAYLGLDRAAKNLGYLWSVFGPEDFMEL